MFEKLALKFLLDKLKREKRYAITFWKRLYRRAPILTVLVAIIPVGGFSYLGWWGHTKYKVLFARQEQHLPSNTMGDVIGNKGIITQGQQGDNYLQTQKPPRFLTDAMKEAMLEKIPKGKIITVRYVAAGDEVLERKNLAEQIYKFLTVEGYKLAPEIQTFLPLGDPVIGVRVGQPSRDDQGYTILVGINDLK